MDNYPQGYRPSSCEGCCEYNDRERRKIETLEKTIKLMAKFICAAKGYPDFELDSVIDFYRQKAETECGQDCGGCGKCATKEES